MIAGGGDSGRGEFVSGALWAIAAAVSFAVMMTSVRHLGGRFDAFEIVFVRSLVGLFMVIPLVAGSGLRALRPTRLPLHVVRTLFALFAMVTLYYALAEIPVADAIALTFLIPLFTTVAAVVVLRERVGLHRWTATLVGFGGALVIIRPGFVALEIPVLLAVLSSVLYAGAWSCVKILTHRFRRGHRVLDECPHGSADRGARGLRVGRPEAGGCAAAAGHGGFRLGRACLPGARIRCDRYQRRHAVRFPSTAAWGAVRIPAVRRDRGCLDMGGRGHHLRCRLLCDAARGARRDALSSCPASRRGRGPPGRRRDREIHLIGVCRAHIIDRDREDGRDPNERQDRIPGSRANERRTRWFGR